MHLKQELIRSGGGNSSHSLHLCCSTSCWWQKEATEKKRREDTWWRMASSSHLPCRGLRTNPLVVLTQGVWQVAFWWLPRAEKKIYCHPPPSLTPHLGGTLRDGKAVHVCFLFLRLFQAHIMHRLSFYQRAGQFGNLATQQ